MERKISIALGLLHPRSDRHLRRVDRARAENGKILEDEPDMRVGSEQRDRIGQGAFAIAATVIKELHQRDVAIGVAENGLMRRMKQALRKGANFCDRSAAS